MNTRGGPTPHAKASDDAAFDAWYESVRPRVLASLVIMSGDRELALEATDEALARAFERWGRVHAMDNPDGWVYRVALNDLRRQARRQLRERRAPLAQRPAADESFLPDPALWSAIRSLAPSLRTAVVLRYVSDLKEKDVAVAMGITPGAVSRALHDARRILARMLELPNEKVVDR